jgi:RimJ/RimL family protein N-acetyltransferase
VSGPRILLEPLRVDHAGEMAAVLAAPVLYHFTGGRPPTGGELRERYARQVRGRSPDGRQQWRNWIVRRASDGAPLGFVQATIADGTAELAWTIGAAHQGHGYAREAAVAMCALLRGEGVAAFTAHIHPGHAASAAVAGALGLAPTDRVDDGEILWRAPAARRPAAV